MVEEGGDLSANPYYNNVLVLDLLSWEIVNRAEADNLFKNPWVEARRVERTVLVEVINNRVARWKEEFTASTSPVALRWPHTVFPPIS